MASSKTEAELKAEAFRAVVKDDASALAEIIANLPAQTWRQWENKAGRTLLAMTHERHASKSQKVLSDALALLPVLASDPKLMTKAWDAVFNTYFCSTAIVTRNSELREILAELPTPVWSTWQSESGQSLFGLAKVSTPCSFSDCRYKEIDNPRGNAVCVCCRGHRVSRPSAIEILKEAIDLAKIDLQHRVEADPEAFLPIELQVGLLSGETMPFAVRPESTLGELKAALKKGRALGKDCRVDLLYRGKILDRDSDQLPVAWWASWGDFDNLTAVCRAKTIQEILVDDDSDSNDEDANDDSD